MKKHLLALAALATVSGVAAAQSATVYGIVDLSVSKVTKATDGTNNGSLTALTDAVWMPSVFGVTGSEDLGGGLKATFNLESDVNIDTGRLSAASATGASATGVTKLFGRKSNVGLSGNFGSVTVGKDIDMLFLQGFIDNIRNAHSASGFVAHTLATDLRLDTESVFIQNMVRYTTPTVAGFKASIQHRFGETAGNTQKDSSTGYLLNYAAGSLTANVGFKEMKNTSLEKTELTYVGATYTLGAVKFAATHHETKYDVALSTGSKKIKTDEVGVAYSISPQLTAAVNYVRIDRGVANADSTVTSGSLKYALSKRTNLWTLLSKSNNDASGSDAGASSRPIYSGLNQAGKDSTAYSVGITHSF